MPTLAPKLPWTHAFAGGYPRVAGQATPTDPDAIDYLNRVAAADGAGVEVGVAMAVDTFIKGCKSDGIWDAIKASCLLCGPRTLSGALVPLVGTAPTSYAFASGDYNRVTGLKGDGATTYLDTNRTANADGQNDSHHAVYATDGGTGLHYKIGAYSASAGSFVAQRTTYASGGNRPSVYQNVGGAGAYTNATISGNATGFYAGSRSNSAEFSYRLPGDSGTHAAASVAPGSLSIYAFGFNNNGSFAGQFDGRLAFYSIGASLDLSKLDTRISTYVAAIAAAL